MFLTGDLFALTFSTGFALSLLRIFEETARRGVFDQACDVADGFTVEIKLYIEKVVHGSGGFGKWDRTRFLNKYKNFVKLNRKLVHITIGLAFMLCWPLFSSGYQGAFVAALVPGVNVVKVLLIGLGIMKDEATVKSMTRFGDHRELIKGPLYYASTITLAGMIYWRTSPISIAAICNLCAGDGFADIIGRQFGKRKLPYNCDKSFAGSMAMAIAGFIASLGFMYYFSAFGFIERSLQMVAGFLVVSLVSALVESHPISTKLDDNLTVPLASVLLGTLVF